MGSPATWFDVALAATFPLTLVVVLLNRQLLKRGLGVRIIQFTLVAFLVPAVTLLALHDRLEGETVGAILAGLAGYVLGNVLKFDDREQERTES